MKREDFEKMANKKKKKVESRKPEEAASVPAVVEKPAGSVGLTPIDTLKEVLPMELEPYRGISQEAFAPKAVASLLAPIKPEDVEIRPDGIVYYPEIFYRRRLNEAFGPGGWALMPRGEFTKMDDTLTRCYALFVGGRFVSEVIGEMDMVRGNDEMSWATVAEGVRSNSLMRCCKDIGIASECWDPGFIAQWKKDYAVQVWRENKARPQWRRKDRDPWYDEKPPRGQGQRQEYTGQQETHREFDKLKEESDKLKQTPKQGQQTKQGAQKKGPSTIPSGKAVVLTKAQSELREAIKGLTDRFEKYIAPADVLVEITRGFRGLPNGADHPSKLSDTLAVLALRKFKETLPAAEAQLQKAKEADKG